MKLIKIDIRIVAFIACLRLRITVRHHSSLYGFLFTMIAQAA